MLHNISIIDFKRRTRFFLGAKLLYEFVCPSLTHIHTHSLTYILSQGCNKFFLRLNASRISFIELTLQNTKCLYASKLLYEPACSSLSHSLSHSVIQSPTIFCPPYIIQNNVQITYSTTYKMFVCFKALL